MFPLIAPLLLMLFPTPGLAQDQRAVLDLVVNGVPAGESIVVLREADVLISATALSDAGLRGLAGRRETVGDREYVSLGSLAPEITFSVDEIGLQLIVTASPDLLQRRVRNLWTGPPADLVHRNDTSAFTNYSINWRGGRKLDFYSESAVNLRGAVLYSTFSAADRAVTRGLTSVTIDERRRMRRWTLGDSFTQGGPLGGGAWIAGLNVSREFAIDPYFVRYPTLSLSTPVFVPSVMEVHVNGRIVSQEQVAPGRLDLREIPMTAGRNDAQIILRDAFGTVREVSSADYYLTTTALAPGVHDYQYSIGFRRESLGSKSWDYSQPVALARHRVGLTDTITAGGRLEVAPGLLSGGPSMNLRLPFGEIEAAAALSRRRAGWRGAGLTSYTYAGRRASAGGSLMVMGKRYATVTSAPGEDTHIDARAYGSLPLGDRASATVQHSLTRLHQKISRSRSSVLATVHLTRRLEISAAYTRTHGETGRGREVYAGLTITLGRGSVSVSAVRDARGARMATEAQLPAPVGIGYGAHMRAESGPNGSITGTARYQGQYGRYEVRQDAVDGATHTTLSASGALVGIGGGVYATRPVQDSYALVRVPGVKGVRAFASHQEIGRTGRGGNLVVPDLQAYYGNILNIADDDIPLDYSVGAAGMTLAPPYRSGALAVFPVDRIRQIVGSVRVVAGGNERTPSHGEITLSVAGKSVVSPVGSEGQFYFENLPAGHYPAVVTDRGGTCAFTLDVPASDTSIVKVGQVRCVARDLP